MGWKANSILKGGYSTYLNGQFHKFQGLYESLDEIKDSMEETLRYAESVEDQNRELLNEHWKDEKLSELLGEIDRLSNMAGFYINDEEMKKIDEWKDCHWTNTHNAPDSRSRIEQQGAIGGAFEYRFVPTSIGVAGTICCTSCMAKVESELAKLGDMKRADYLKKKRELLDKYDADFYFQDLT